MPAIPIIGVGLAAAGLGTSIVSGVKANKAGKEAAEQASLMGEENAQVLEGQAGQVERGRSFGLASFDDQAGQLIGAQRATEAVGGFISGSGSSAANRSDTVRNLRSDRINLHENYQVKIDELHNKARLSREYGASQSDILNTQASAGAWGAVGNSLNFANAGLGYGEQVYNNWQANQPVAATV